MGPLILPGVSVPDTISWRKVTGWASFEVNGSSVCPSQLWSQGRTTMFGVTTGAHSFEVTQNSYNTSVSTINIHNYKWESECSSSPIYRQ